MSFQPYRVSLCFPILSCSCYILGASTTPFTTAGQVPKEWTLHPVDPVFPHLVGFLMHNGLSIHFLKKKKKSTGMNFKGYGRNYVITFHQYEKSKEQQRPSSLSK
jgi:hypothetical protein